MYEKKLTSYLNDQSRDISNANDDVVPFIFWVMIRRRPAPAHANDRSAINGRAIF